MSEIARAYSDQGYQWHVSTATKRWLRDARFEAFQRF
jgi:hypothetical protein